MTPPRIRVMTQGMWKRLKKVEIKSPEKRIRKKGRKLSIRVIIVN